MKRKIVSGIMLTLLLTGMLTLAFNIQSVKSEPRTIVVPDDYEKIRWAIGNASDGDSIFVKAGTYYESVVVNKAVSLIGENRSGTIIDGNGMRWVVHVNANDVRINGFTIRNGGAKSNIIPCGGIYLDFSSGSNVSDNNILNNTGNGGIYLVGSSHNVISGNTITNNSWTGLDISSGCDENTVSRNIVSNNVFGIALASSSNDTLRDNNMTNNQFNFNVWGLHLSPSHYIHDIDTSNTVNGKPIYYLVNERDKQVPPNAGYVAAINCVNITVKDVTLKNVGTSVLFVNTNSSVIQSIIASNNSGGIYLLNSSYNIIVNSEITHLLMAADGIYLRNSHSNMISDNIISNTAWGIQLFYSNENTIIRNMISNNYIGIYVASNNSIIYHNNFIDNTDQISCYKSPNTWDNGAEGNYWSDYTGVDLYSGPYQNVTGSDGIGDIPYVINENNVDKYPLIYPYGYVPSPDVNGDQIVNMYDIFIAASAFGSYPGHPAWNPIADTKQDGIIDIFDLVIIGVNFGNSSLKLLQIGIFIIQESGWAEFL